MRYMKYKKYIKNIFTGFAIFEYFNITKFSEASFMPYILWGVFGIYTLIYNNSTNNKNINTISKIGACIFSIFISLANYDAVYKSLSLWPQYKIFYILKYIIFFIGIYVLFVNIIDFLLKKKFKVNLFNDIIYDKKFIYYYMIFIFLLFNLVYILGYYPVLLTSDSISQVSQVINNSYSNHHPVFHTYLIGFVFSFFKNAPNNNLAVFAFCEMQIIVFTLIHAYAYYVLKKNKKLNIIFVLLPLINVVNIYYSFTLWKDILFSYAIFLFIIEIYNVINEKNIKIYNYVILIVSSFCICLFRSNGFIAMVLFLIISIIYTFICSKKNNKTKYNKKNNKIRYNSINNIVFYIVGAVLVVSFILINSVKNDDGIKKVSIVESLSIPIQQMSRVIVDGNIIDEEDIAFVEKIIPIEKVKILYENHTSDPVKFYISRNKVDELIVDNKNDCIKLYLKWLFKYPTSYIKGFLDETSGYYNGSYNVYWLVITGMGDVDKVNIYFAPFSILFHKLMNAVIYVWSNSDITAIFIGIGFSFFVFIMLLLKTIYDKKSIIPYVMILAVWITLILSTPVWSEYRYLYSLILALPFYLALNT